MDNTIRIDTTLRINGRQEIVSMNTYQQKLFNDLTNLVNTSEAFYSQDEEFLGKIFRKFNYRLATYTDFQLPNALECRGHVFEVNADGDPIRLACLPMQKFFNHEENPFTMNVDFSQTKQIMTKADGSLISTVDIDGEVFVKSKFSFKTSQAKEAQASIDAHPKFKDELKYLERHGYTVNMEYTSPKNPIVLSYDDDYLHVLNVRNRMNGDYLDLTTSCMKHHFPH